MENFIHSKNKKIKLTIILNWIRITLCFFIVKAIKRVEQINVAEKNKIN